MNRKYLTIIVAVALSGLATGFSEDPPASPQPVSPGNGMDRKRIMRDKFLEGLPPEVRNRFEAVRNKAMEDPKIKELKAAAEKSNMELFKAVREKMLELDPGLADLIKKREENGPGKGSRPEGGGMNSPGMASLTDAEREKLMAAREKAKADPSVMEADKKKEAATSPEERKAAMDDYRKAMHAAILKGDPSLAPLLEKLTPPKPPAPAASNAPVPPK